MTRFLCAVILSAAVIPLTAAAQTPDSTTADTLRSSIAATVRDSLGFPVVAASVFITPGGHIYRTDSAGRFNARIPAGALAIRIRKLGFSPLQSNINLHIGVDLSLDLVMQRLPQMLAEVEVKGERQCQRYALEGILCRQVQYAGSYFMNRQDVLAASKDIYHPNLVLRDAPGFRQNLNGNPTTVESIVGWRCWIRIVDGGFPGAARNIYRPKDIHSVEIYQPPNIPLEYRHWYWGNTRVGRRTTSAPCALVVMWSTAEAQRQLKKMAKEK